ncbi:CcoQ/FixQ family Cbb3-type cytochrome c oxidase assembly chaperone [Novosphingobium sp. Fuku2-ISO-50]|jgi:cytochrome c oxidase cbb3-type subunit 4|uniref:CcoQ/FixQ family Cbb3-type cytochrome c oxidase assembly chaperone n=1 Tax=Novosphingobium sp. Fuku2-ISO-50 TaxID=1739114 RepID=UPI00076C1356|nr:CcoQ/FixQ family Cbb3-type cytochrome c oxidase assembly chaperone [Novosphingobium sp. Fuku2-ISO-50]KUR78383.1 cytochrome C oxidase Cbb3 [Novosphingobium sp. Fuku2-ISO-50]
MNAASTYNTLRALADSWGLAVMALVFLVLCLWPFRPGARAEASEAANSIFEDENDGE